MTQALVRLIILVILFTSCEEVKVGRFAMESDTEEANNPLTPITWGYGDSVVIKGLSDSTIFKRNHPLDIGRHALYVLERIQEMRSEDSSMSYKPYLEYLKKYPYRIETDSSVVYAYGFNHHNFIKGEWWSAMANSTISLAFWKGFKASNDSSYYREFEFALNGVLNPTYDHGCALNFGDTASWYLEYADHSSDEANAYFVLNGFLYTLVNLKILAQETGIAEIQRAYELGVAGFFQKKDSFYYGPVSWTRYMLHPETVEPAHYAIFDLLLFESLKILDGSREEIWNKEMEHRRAILNMAYPIYKKDDNTLFFSALGPPHPYWLDTYPLTLQMNFMDSESFNYRVKDPRDLEVGLLTRAFHTLPIPDEKGLLNVNVYAVYAKDSVLLYSINGPHSLTDTLSEEESQFPWNLYSGNVLAKKKVWVLDHETDSLLKHVDFSAQLVSRGVNQSFYYGFRLNSSIEVKSLRILLIDENGQSAERYYQLPKEDVQNLILFHPAGFKHIDRLDFSGRLSVRIMIYYQSDCNGPEKTIELGNLMVFENTMEVADYMRENNLVIPEKTKKGNIY